MDHEAGKVAAELQQWAKRMGFNPGPDSDYPSVETFQKLCKGKTIKMWQDIVQHVRPKEEILHMQKNLLLQHLRSGKPPEKDPLPGPLSRQAVIASKLAAKQKERDHLLDLLHKKEISIKTKEKALKKSGHKVAELGSQLGELKKKQLLFKIRTEECQRKLEWYNDIRSHSHSLCPPPSNSKPPAAKTTDTAQTVLHKCVDAVRNFHSNSHRDELEVYEDPKDHLQNLWKQIKSNVSGWGAQQLWDAINTHLLAGLTEEITHLCEEDGKTLRPLKSQASHLAEAMSILPTKYIASVLEIMSLDTKGRIKAVELRNLQEKLIELLQVSQLNTSQMNKSMPKTSDITVAWVEAQSRKAELSAKLLAIKAELVRLKDSSPSLTAASRNLKGLTEELVKLNLQVDHDKKQIEENLAHMSIAPGRLRSARSKALLQRSNFNSQVPLFLQKSKNQFDSESMSPQSKPLSSTMIGNVTADSNLSFETTCESIIDKFGGQSNFSDLVLAIRESVSKEAKLFIKVHLDNVPDIHLNGRKEPMCNLIVRAPMMTARSSSIPHKNFLQIVRGTPFSSVPHIILDQLQACSHIRALHLYKVLHEHNPSSGLEASINLEHIRELTPKQEAALEAKLERVYLSLDGIKMLLSKTQSNLDIWVDRPIQGTVSSLNLTVDALSFDEWCKKFDEVSRKIASAKFD